MHIFQSTRNTRPIIKNCFKYIRSDVPTEIAEEEKEWLLSNNVTTIVDLRTDDERVRKHCPLIDDSRFSYHIFTIAGGDKVPSNTDDVSKSYIAMVDTYFDTMIAFLLNRKSNVLYFCNAGKDRTGVVSAVLLYKLGMSLEYIVNDYLETKFNLETILNEFARRNPTMDIDVITPHKRYIEEFLKWYIDRVKQ